MIITKNISKSYGELLALDNISITIERGEIAGILGPNGAGKTTLFKILTGLIEATSGTYSIKSDKTKKIGAIIENPHLYEYLNAKDNLKVFAQYQGIKLNSTDIETLLEAVGLDINRKDQVRNYSLGMKQRLGIATALLNAPDALILDEPFLGLDPVGMKDLRELLIELAQEKQMAILISSHQIEELSKVCHQLYLLNKGQITASGTTTEILHGATQRFRIAGKGLITSPLLEPYEPVQLGDLILIKATKLEATALLNQLINEGYEIDEFGPELNLENIYTSQ